MITLIGPPRLYEPGKSRLQPDYSTKQRLKIEKIINDVFPLFTDDPFQNIETLTNAVVKEIIDGEAVLKDRKPKIES